MRIQTDRRLITELEVLKTLQIDAGDLDWLVATGQLTPIQIRGKVRFDLVDVDELINEYKRVQGRKKR